MGEVLPNAIMIMAKSAKDAGLTTNGTVQEMMALQQTGGLISAKVLPHFAKNMSEAARANGGLNKAMASNRVAMQRMILGLREAADIIFKSGMSKGLTEFFNESAESIISLKELWEGLGKIIGGVFSIAAKVIKAVTPTLVALGSVINSVSDALGDVGAGFLALAPFSHWIVKLGTRLNPIVAMFTAMAGAIQDAAFWLEELSNVITGGKIGMLNTTGEAMSFGGGGEGYFNLLSDNVTSPPMMKFMKEIGNRINQPTTASPAQPLNVILEVDGEKLSSKLGETESFGNATQGWMQSSFQ